MPYWTHLLQTPTPAPVRQRNEGVPVASAADITPLGWLAAFSPDDVRAFVPALESSRFLTLCTSVRLARERLVRRRDGLRELVQLPLAEHLDLFTEQLGTLDGGAGLQVWLHELVYPFPDDAEARSLLSRALAAFDEPSASKLSALAQLLLEEHRPRSPRFLFDADVAVMKTVGWLEGRGAPGRLDALAPSMTELDEASLRLSSLGYGFAGLHLGLSTAARELAGPCERRDDVLEALGAWETDTLSLDEALLGRPFDFRRALIAELAAREVRLQRLPAEADARLSMALVALGLHGDIEAHLAAVPAALESPDVRIRAGLAFTYQPRDFDEDEDDVAPLDAIWERLARDPEPRVRWAACSHQNSPLKPDDDPHPAVRALRKTTPLLELLALATRTEPLGLSTVCSRREPTPMLVHREALRTLGLLASQR